MRRDRKRAIPADMKGKRAGRLAGVRRAEKGEHHPWFSREGSEGKAVGAQQRLGTVSPNGMVIVGSKCAKAETAL